MREEKTADRICFSCICFYAKGWRKNERKTNTFHAGEIRNDQLSKVLIVLGVVAVLISAFVNWGVLGLIVYFLGWALVIWGYFRVFSRNVSKRYAENEAFLAKTSGIRNFFQKQKYMWQQRKVYHIYKCPGCGQKIRFPEEKGRLRSAVPSAAPHL